MPKKLDYHGLSQERVAILQEEIVMAQALNENELRPMVEEALRRYIGQYVPVYLKDVDLILNEIYPIVQHYLPSIFFQNPRAFLKPRTKTYWADVINPNSGNKERVQLDSSKSARTQEDILNYILSQIGYKKEIRKVLLDALLFPHAVLWHGFKGDFGMTEEQSIYIKNKKIFVRRINPLRFIKDPSVNMANLDEAKWVGRVIDIPLIDVEEDDQLYVTDAVTGKVGYGTKVQKFKDLLLNNLKNNKGGKDSQVPKNVKHNLIDFADKSFQNSKAAKFVRAFELYLRPTKKEQRNGSKGWILLLTDEQKPPLRVNPWKIKAEGWPSKILEFNTLSDNPFGMPDINSYKSIADQKNVITNLQIRNAQENSKVWIGLAKDGAEEDDIEMVRNGQNTIVRFETDDVRKRMFVASPGSVASSELYLIDGRIQRNLEDKSGVTDLKRGFLQSGEESATSVKIRNAGGGARPAYRQDIMSEFLKESFLYINQLDKQFLTVKDAVRIIGSLDLQWSDDPTEESLQADVDVEIDVISMLPENPEKELKELNIALEMMFKGLTVPEVRQKLLEEGKTLELSPLIEQILIRLRLRNPDIFRDIKPEESEGFVSVAEIRAAKANVEAALAGQMEVPSPPSMEQDHVARIETYTSILNLMQDLGDNIASQILGQLVQIHQAMLSEIQSKQATPGLSEKKLSKPFVKSVGSV